MTYEEYYARRERLLFLRKTAALAGCRLTAAARERDIDKLDKEYKKDKAQ